MTPKPKYKSDAFKAIHASAEALNQVHAVEAITMRKFDESCLAMPAQPPSTQAAGRGEKTWAGGFGSIETVVIAEADPQSPEALDLLRLAAVEARTLYPEFHAPSDAWPTK